MSALQEPAAGEPGSVRLSDTDAVGLAALVRDGALSVENLVETAIARIEALNPQLNAVIATRFDDARAEVTAGLPEGPLRGVPILIKDLNLSVAGLPQTNGSQLFAGDIAAQDSELVARYKKAGMVVLGMTNSPEFGLNCSTEPLLHGPTRNPRDLARSAGGSSGGSAAAVAAGMVPVAHASDGGGSIRIPSAWNGLVGLKPSRGRITNAPAPTTLSAPASTHHVVTTSVRDSAVLLDISADRVPGTLVGVPRPAISFAECAVTPPGRLRIAMSVDLGEGAVQTQPEIRAMVEGTSRVLESLGHSVTLVEAPFDPETVRAQTSPFMGVAFTTAVLTRLEELGRELGDGDLEPFTRDLFARYEKLPARSYVKALSDAQRIGWQVGALFDDFEVWLTPTIAVSPPRIGFLDTTDPQVMYREASAYSSWTQVFNATGMPAISLPLGTDELGLPAGVQFAADLGQEGLLLSLAGQLESAIGWPRTV